MEKRDLFQDLEFYNDESDIIPLSMGAPGPEAIAGCNKLFTEATSQLLKDTSEERFVFQYGPLKGDPFVLKHLADFLSLQYGDTVNEDNLLITAGATQGFHLAVTVMTDHNTTIFVEDPTYFIAIKMFSKDFGYNVIPVPTDEHGLDVDAFETILKKNPGHGTKCAFKSFLYCMSVLSNPKGTTLPPERCIKLIKLAREHDILLFVEDVYNLLNYSDHRHPAPRLLSYDKKTDPDYKGNILSNCTFSKILAPGLRLGWIEAPDRIIEILQKSNVTWSGGCFNQYTSRLIGKALQLGLMDNYLGNLCQLYKERMNRACDLLNENLSGRIKFTNPRGGFFLWIELPEEIDTAELLKHSMEKYEVGFIIGASTSPTESFKNCIRLSISFCPMDKIERGITQLCAAIKDFLK